MLAFYITNYTTKKGVCKVEVAIKSKVCYNGGKEGMESEKDSFKKCIVHHRILCVGTFGIGASDVV